MAGLKKLMVYMNGDLVGELKRLSNAGLEFRYDENWINDYPDFPISRRFPVTEEVYKGSDLNNYFENLLPDGKEVREKIAANLQAGSTSGFDLLSVIGKDCIGALQLVPESWEAPKVEAVKGEELTEDEILKTLDSLFSQPLGMDREEDFRISLAGNQEKTALLKWNGKWLRPLGASPTTHIFKPSMGVFANGIDMSESVDNEFLSLKIFEHFGLDVAQAEILKLEERKVFVVERFDRRIKGNKIFRLPQEDMCQALGHPSSQKYQSDGGPGIEAIMKLLKESNQAEKDQKDFIKAQVLNWLMAGIDAHAKNFSIFWQPGGFQLTPIYDVLSAASIMQSGGISPHKIKMAMHIGDNKHYKWNDIGLRHWYQTAARIKYPKSNLEEILHEIVDAFRSSEASVSKQLPEDFSDEVKQGIFSLLDKNIAKLSS